MADKGNLDHWSSIQKGDKTAFDKLYHAHIDSLYNYGACFTSNLPLLEDAIQEIFINIWTKRSTITIHSNIKGYLFTALRRQLLTQIEQQKKTVLNINFLEKTSYQKVEHITTDQRLGQVKRAISKLSKREREAIVLKYQEGLSYDEISHLMNLQNHAIYKLVSRGVKKIKFNIKSNIRDFILK